MYICRFLKKLFLCLFVILFLQNILILNVYASSNLFEDRFEIEIPALPTNYNNLSINLENHNVKIENGKVIIENLVPDQLYENVKIAFVDDIGREYELEFDTIITSKPVKVDNKFIYDAYVNGLGRVPDKLGFKYWKDSLENFDVTAVEFVKEMINSEEFNLMYDASYKKLIALYKIILGRDPDRDGFIYWMVEFLSMRDDLELSESQAIIELVNEMIDGDEFKNLVEETGFLYSR